MFALFVVLVPFGREELVEVYAELRRNSGVKTSCEAHGVASLKHTRMQRVVGKRLFGDEEMARYIAPLIDSPIVLDSSGEVATLMPEVEHGVAYLGSGKKVVAVEVAAEHNGNHHLSYRLVLAEVAKGVVQFHRLGIVLLRNHI